MTEQLRRIVAALILFLSLSFGLQASSGWNFNFGYDYGYDYYDSYDYWDYDDYWVEDDYYFDNYWVEEVYDYSYSPHKKNSFFDKMESYGAFLASPNDQFLGYISRDPYHRDSLANDSIFSGTYGSSWSSDSIFNSWGKYGSSTSKYSPFNAYASYPPEVVVQDKHGVLIVVAYLTVNPFYRGEYDVPNVDPDQLVRWLDTAKYSY